jgi:TolB-like protein
MKRKYSAILLVGFICLGCGTIYAADTLEKAIERQADYITRNSPHNTVLAIVSMKSDSELLSEYIMEKLPDHVVNNKENITVVDRSRLDIIQQEINFQYSGEVSDETMVSIGKKIGAQVIVAGAIIEAGRVYNYSIKLLDVESAKILGSNSTQIKHDETMEGFLSGSYVAQLALNEAQQKRLKHEAAVSTIKKALGIFPNGIYLGYLGSLSLPIGLSFGGINEGVGYFIETGFCPPVFQGYEHQNDFSYNGNVIQSPSQGFTYTNENEKTAFLWDLIVGLNINIVKTLLWANIGAGFEYRQDYKLFTEISVSDSNKIWAKNKSDDKLHFVMSAGLYIKLWYFYIQGKYKYVLGEEIDRATYGLNNLSLGVGYVWRRN